MLKPVGIQGVPRGHQIDQDLSARGNPATKVQETNLNTAPVLAQIKMRERGIK